MDTSYFDGNRNKGYQIALSGLRIVFRILILVLIVVLIFFGAKKIYALGYESFSAKPVADSEDKGENKTIVITKDMSVREIGELLIEEGLIDESVEAFIIQANVYGYAHSIVPKPYVLNTAMSVSEMLEFMSQPEEDEEEEN